MLRYFDLNLRKTGCIESEKTTFGLAVVVIALQKVQVFLQEVQVFVEKILYFLRPLRPEIEEPIFSKTRTNGYTIA